MCEARPGPPRDVRQAVPSEATCNAYVARCLARAAMAFLRDVEAEDAAAGSGCGRRLVVVDVGAGHAALTWLLSQVGSACAQTLDLRATDVRRAEHSGNTKHDKVLLFKRECWALEGGSKHKATE